MSTGSKNPAYAPPDAAYVIAAISMALTAGACKKSISSSEAIFYGMWTKGTNMGGTMWFYRQSGKNLVRYSMSFNPTMPVYEEFTYQRFSWKQQGKEFEI